MAESELFGRNTKRNKVLTIDWLSSCLFLTTLCQQSLNELENLYGTFSQKAFKDELDLSRIPLDLESRNTPKKREKILCIPWLIKKLENGNAGRTVVLSDQYAKRFSIFSGGKLSPVDIGGRPATVT